MEEYGNIEEHPKFPDVIDYIEKIGNYTKEDLIAILYEDSGEGETKKDLRSKSRGELLALAVDAMFGGTCQ